MSTTITRPSNYFRKLDQFLVERTVADINRETYLICNLEDLTNKITISCVFIKDCENIECGSFENCIIPNKGAVFVFPCYWLCVPKELAYTYLTSVIDEFYSEYVTQWTGGIWIGGNNSSGATNNNLNNCGCPCIT